MKVVWAVWVASVWVAASAAPAPQDINTRILAANAIPAGHVVTSIQHAQPISHVFDSTSADAQAFNLDEFIRQITGSSGSITSANFVRGPINPNFGQPDPATSSFTHLQANNINRQGFLLGSVENFGDSREFDFGGGSREDGVRIITSPGVSFGGTGPGGVGGVSFGGAGGSLGGGGLSLGGSSISVGSPDIVSSGPIIGGPGFSVGSISTVSSGPGASYVPPPAVSLGTPSNDYLPPPKTIVTETIISAPKQNLLVTPTIVKPELPFSSLGTSTLGALLSGLTSKGVKPTQTFGSLLRGLDGQDGIVVVDIDRDVNSFEDDTVQIISGGVSGGGSDALGTALVAAKVGGSAAALGTGLVAAKAGGSAAALGTGLVAAKAAKLPKFLFQGPLSDILLTKGQWLGTLLGGLVDIGDSVFKGFGVKDKLF